MVSGGMDGGLMFKFEVILAVSITTMEQLSVRSVGQSVSPSLTVYINIFKNLVFA